MASDSELFNIRGSIYVEKPQRDIHSFIGTFSRAGGTEEDSLDLENTLWANTVIAAGRATGMVVYTGCETRSVMNNSTPRSKVGLIDMEINNLTKLLFCAVIGLALVMMCLKGFNGPWYRYMFRFVLLFSYIIPISLRVNLDMGKSYYSYKIQKDKEIQGTVVRSTTIPEELGRISYLLTDKTGTLTRNEMIFKKIHLGNVWYEQNTFDDVAAIIQSLNVNENNLEILTNAFASPKVRRSDGWRIWEAVKAIAVCHNVTPINESNKNNGNGNDRNSPTRSISIESSTDDDVNYQAASPDEIALVKWSEHIGLTLVARDLDSMTLQLHNVTVDNVSSKKKNSIEMGSVNTAVTMLTAAESRDALNSTAGSSYGGSSITLDTIANAKLLRYQILQMFPFTSESKRMGIIVKDMNSGEITFYLKGADIVMSSIVEPNDWSRRECTNMAKEGLRTLVVAKKVLTNDEYLAFEADYAAARLCVSDRGVRVQAVIESLECDMELLCLTGVEDSLQDRVPQTLELLRKAGVKIWMLTGDKLETAQCIAKSSHLVESNQEIHVIKSVSSRYKSA